MSNLSRETNEFVLREGICLERRDNWVAHIESQIPCINVTSIASTFTSKDMKPVTSYDSYLLKCLLVILLLLLTC